ncbi:MAG: molecular chaperone [Hyphomicrobiales bacterium]|nr:molecular chaperone [Hyphomicrobiales bacterium]MDE2016502.1 molecular chaperone [Hyphomicrobiales bacterium]
MIRNGSYAVACILAAGFAFASPCAVAASLEIAPVLVDVPAPGAAGIVNLRNAGTTPLNAQVRVFRWTQTHGVDLYDATGAVVASPPLLTMPPGSTYALRVVRVSTAPIDGEESYRVVIDELPDPTHATSGVRLALRYLVPAFFEPATFGPPKLTWTYSKSGGALKLTARNDGGRRVRISALVLRDARGHVARFGGGLAGYALAHSSVTFVARGKVTGFAGGAATVDAMGDLGKLHAVARP